jgi:hypothetical protein
MDGCGVNHGQSSAVIIPTPKAGNMAPTSTGNCILIVGHSTVFADAAGLVVEHRTEATITPNES